MHNPDPLREEKSHDAAPRAAAGAYGRPCSRGEASPSSACTAASVRGGDPLRCDLEKHGERAYDTT